MTKRPRIIAYAIRRRMRLSANSKSYHVEAQGFNAFPKGMTWRSVQRAPLAIGQEAAARMLHRQIMQEAAAYQQIYQTMADSVHESFKRLGYYGGGGGKASDWLPPKAAAGDLVAATMPKHYNLSYRVAQRGRGTLPQPVTAGSNRGE